MNKLRAAKLCLPLFLVSCNFCGDTSISKVVSADGQLVATVYERNCVATTDFSSIVNVQSPSLKFNGDQGQLFIAKGRYDISLSWTGARALLIKCRSCTRKNIFREVSALGDVDVTYSLGSDAGNTP
jgi:hypothetical protein